MSGQTSNVSNRVCSIIISFTSGLDVFRKVREKRRKRKASAKAEREADEELQLSRSLRRGPLDIQERYTDGVRWAGDGFAVGDAIAQSSLTDTLLRLNAGLVGIISAFLSQGKHDLELDYRSLTRLSDQSRTESVNSLHQLHQRMSQMHIPATVNARDGRLPRDRNAITDKSANGEKSKRRHNIKENRIRAPQLARVFIANTSDSQIAMVRPGNNRKRSPSSTISGSSGVSSNAQSKASTALTTPRTSPPPEYTPQAPTWPVPDGYNGYFEPQNRQHLLTQSSTDLHRPPPTSRPVPAPALKAKRQQSAADLPSAGRQRQQRSRLHANLSAVDLPSGSRTRLLQRERLPPPPPSRPLEPLPEIAPAHTRHRPTTYYSIASNGTKLGEIPMHHWAIPPDFDAMSRINREAEMNGWPYPEGGIEGRKKGRFGFMKLFKKKTPTVEE